MSDRTKPERKPFFSIAEEIDTVAEQVARRKGIPTLTPPSAIDTPAAHIVPGPSNDKPAAPATVTHESRAAVLPAAREAPVPSALRPARASYVKVKCPDYLLDQLYEQTRKERITLNHLILTALRAQGFRVDDADMVEDGRRLRGRLTQADNQGQR
jgi:hypothetical protein